jgi:hypothetical protein
VEAGLIYFFADGHFNARPGHSLYEKLKEDKRISFFEDDISILAKPDFLDDCSLLIINMICGTGKLELPGADTEAGLKKYCESRRPLLLIHAGSAAFAGWEWWRKLTGLRWVRANDPEGEAPSVHPVKDFEVVPVKSHPLSSQLRPFTLCNDEIYTRLKQECPVQVFMETKIDEGVFPMAFESKNQWGGSVFGFLPGHGTEAFENIDMIGDIVKIIEYAVKTP